MIAALSAQQPAAQQAAPREPATGATQQSSAMIWITGTLQQKEDALPAGVALAALVVAPLVGLVGRAAYDWPEMQQLLIPRTCLKLALLGSSFGVLLVLVGVQLLEAAPLLPLSSLVVRTVGC